MINPGRYNRHELSNEAYHGAEGISSSHLKCIHTKSLKHYRYEYILSPEPFQASPEMNLGKYVHAVMLEPEAAIKEFIVQPKMDRRTKKGKEAYEKFTSELGNRTPLLTEQLECANGMLLALKSNAITSRILDGAVTEESIIHSDPFCGFRKCRADILNEELGFVADIKIANAFSFRKFENDIRYLGYDLQAAYYLDQWSMDKFIVICVESEPPFDIVVYEFSDELIAQGRAKYEAALEKLLLARDTNEWPGRAESMVVADLRRWEME